LNMAYHSKPWGRATIGSAFGKPDLRLHHTSILNSGKIKREFFIANTFK